MTLIRKPSQQIQLRDESLRVSETSYSFEDMLADGSLIKVTSWVTREMGFAEGRYRIHVAMTVRLWEVLHRIPKELTFFHTIRGRGHDVLWLAGWALRRARRQGLEQVRYLVALPTDENEEDAKLLHAELGKSGDGRSHVVVGLPEEFPL